MTNYEKLAAFIVTKAVTEYRSIYKKYHLKKLRKANKEKCTKNELLMINLKRDIELMNLENFFNSSWCEILSGYHPGEIMAVINNQKKEWESEVYSGFVKSGCR